MPAQQQDPWQRFIAQVAVNFGRCWLWQGYCDRTGYGRFMLPRVVDGRYRDAKGRPTQKLWLAHRFMWIALGGNLDNGAVLDHLCRTPSCVSPFHLEVVTQKENCAPGLMPGAQARRTNKCHKGHSFTAQNTIIGSHGQRNCRTCTNQRARERRAAHS